MYCINYYYKHLTYYVYHISYIISCLQIKIIKWFSFTYWTVSKQDIAFLFPDLTFIRVPTLSVSSILLRTPLHSKARRSPGGALARNKAASAETVWYTLVTLIAAHPRGRIIRFRQIAYPVALSANIDEVYSNLLFTVGNISSLLDLEGLPMLGVRRLIARATLDALPETVLVFTKG